MASSTSNRLSEYLPLLAFVAAWSLQLAYFLGYDARLFFTYGFGIIYPIMLAVGSYVLGFLLCKALPIARSAPRQRPVRTVADLRAMKVLLQLTVAISAGLITTNILLPLLSGNSLSGAREIALENWERGDVLSRVLAIAANFAIAFSLVAILDSIDTKERFPLLLVLMFIALTIAAYSRAHLLLGLSIISTKWISQSKYRLSYIFFAFMLFAGLFSILSVVASVGSANRESGVEDILKSLEVYTFGGVAGFEFYYTTGFPQYNSLLTIPRFMYSILPGLGNLPPSYFPFIDTNPPINVFSALYPPYHDFGRYGLIVFFFVYGLLSALAAFFFQKRPSRFMCVISGFLLYAALMSPFDDQFIRGLTVFILVIAGTILYTIIFRTLRNAMSRV